MVRAWSGCGLLPPNAVGARSKVQERSAMAPPPPFGANSAAARDVANVLHPYTDLKAHLEVGPVIVSHGKGVRVWDDAGKQYIEGVAGLWCAALGFDNERLVQATAAQMRKS